jgi:hypothetical protein
MSNNTMIMLTDTSGDQVFFNGQHVFAIRPINPMECVVVSTGGSEVAIRVPAGTVAMAVNGVLNKGPGC